MTTIEFLTYSMLPRNKKTFAMWKKTNPNGCVCDYFKYCSGGKHTVQTMFEAGKFSICKITDNYRVDYVKLNEQTGESTRLSTASAEHFCNAKKAQENIDKKIENSNIHVK